MAATKLVYLALLVLLSLAMSCAYRTPLSKLEEDKPKDGAHVLDNAVLPTESTEGKPDSDNDDESDHPTDYGTQPGYGIPQPAYGTQPVYGFPEPDYGQPVYGIPGPVYGSQPGFPGPVYGNQPVYDTQPGFPEPGYGYQPGFPEPGYGYQPGFPEPVYSNQPVYGTQPGYDTPQPGYGTPPCSSPSYGPGRPWRSENHMPVHDKLQESHTTQIDSITVLTGAIRELTDIIKNYTSFHTNTEH